MDKLNCSLSKDRWAVPSRHLEHNFYYFYVTTEELLAEHGSIILGLLWIFNKYYEWLDIYYSSYFVVIQNVF